MLNVVVFWLGFRLAVEREIKARRMLPGAVLSAIVWQILQLFGAYLVAHTCKSSSVYGVFGVVLGLLAWLFLQAQFTLYAVEANVVSDLRLWPRSLSPPPLTAEDRRAYRDVRADPGAAPRARGGEPDHAGPGRYGQGRCTKSQRVRSRH